MFKKIILVVSLTFLFTLFSKAQEGLVKCHTYEMQDAYFNAHPERVQQAKWLKQQMLIKAKQLEAVGLPKDGDPYIIPVVFHVVHVNGPENITVNQIEDAIKVMNLDFSASSVGIESVNDEFEDIIGDVGIEFRLAKLDPDGNCTNGIVRTVSDVTNYGGENLKEASPIWDRSKYMNIWVCKSIASGAAGYTYYPSTLAGDFGETNDGIVVRYDYVGSIGESNFGRSQTLSHEVGHWIDLPHLWGSTNEPGLESNCESDDDIADTPNTIGWTTCNTSGQTCGSLDNVQNFMEYSFCGRMFTEGQKVRMISALTSAVAERNNLWTEENLSETGVLLEDQLCAVDFAANANTICSGNTIEFLDYSHSGIAERSWIFEGGSPATSSEYNPTITYNEPGTYSVSLLVSDSSGSQLTEVKESYIHVLDTGTISLPFSESFVQMNEFSEFPENDLFVENVFGEDYWEISDQTGSSDDYSAVFRGDDTQSETVLKSAIVSKTFQLSNVGDNPVFTFKRAAARSSQSSSGELWVFISKDCGDLWSLRKAFDEGDMYTTSNISPGEYLPADEDWVEEEIGNIISVFHNETFRIRFEYRGTNGGTVYIDDINVYDPQVLNIAYRSAPELDFSIYPNPSSGRISLELSEELLPIESISVRDLSGRVVFRESPTYKSKTSFDLNLGSLSKGIYLVEIKNPIGVSAKKVMIE